MVNIPYYFLLFGRQIPLYGICFYSGIATAVIFALLFAKQRGLPRWEIIYSAIYIMTGAIIGAKLLFILVSMDEIIRLKLSVLAVIKGGFVFYGGLVGGLLGLLIYTRQYKMKLTPFLDIYATVLPLGHAIGRVGCFFGGCCYGIRYDGIFRVVYEQTAGQTPLGVGLLPIQLIEAIALLSLFFMQLFLFKRKKFAGRQAWSYIVSYSIIRFFLEFFRGDKIRGSVLWLSTSQWISLIMLCTVPLYLYYRKKISQTNEVPPS